MYKNHRSQYEDTKSSAYSFLIVGALGILLLILLHAGKLPVTVAPHLKLMITIVMGLVFTIFLVIGIRSLWILPSIAQKAGVQEDFQEKVISQFMETYKEELLEYQPAGYSKEEIYYPRSNRIRSLLLSDYKDMEEDMLEYFIEILYSQIYG